MGTVYKEEKIVTLNHLTTLDLAYDYQQMEYTRNVTPWMVAAVIYAEDLPCLENWVLDPHIEWDIFFIMLETRNTTTSPTIKPNVRPIKSIKFASTISKVPFQLLRLIPQVLAGKRVARPSNFELSWRGNLDVMVDMDVYASLLLIAHSSHRL